jgi:hypothetical protein
VTSTIDASAAPPTLSSHAIDDGNIMIVTAMPPGADYMPLAALIVALIHGVLTRPGVKRPYLLATRILPPALLGVAAIWVWLHIAWRIPVLNFEGFKPMGEPLLMAIGFLVYGTGDALLFMGDPRWRASVGAALGVAGLTLLAVCGWRIQLFEMQPPTDILLVLAVSLAAAGLMIPLWRWLGGKVFGWLFLGALIALSFVIGGMTSHSFIRLPGLMLACGLTSLAARVLVTTGRAGSKGMAGWGPWFATVLFQIMIAITGLGAPTF